MAVLKALRHQPACHAMATEGADWQIPAGCCLQGRPACRLWRPALLPSQRPCVYTDALCPSLDPAQAVLEQQPLLHYSCLLPQPCLLGLCCLAEPCLLAGARLMQLLAAQPQQPVLTCQRLPPHAELLVH